MRKISLKVSATIQNSNAETREPLEPREGNNEDGGEREVELQKASRNCLRQLLVHAETLTSAAPFVEGNFAAVVGFCRPGLTRGKSLVAQRAHRRY
jgi:hypothetical protein